MAYTIDVRPKAARQLEALPPRIQRQVAARIDSLAVDPRPPGSKKLKGVEELYRLRSGDYRIIYQVQDKRLLVLVLRIADRKDVYWDL
ncbi:MAG: type II toxin-antitoxin system RelE/ParE family toxin [Planctomycetes bacterium]|nr:type II toxin-antitoxin system RelE/ParE family toxin [Planctomycetota bacterium]